MYCPLTGALMENPYKNTACNHSYEKEAIFSFIKNQTKTCPVVGCSKVVTRQSLVHDLELETIIKEFRKNEELERKKKTAALDLEDDEDVIL